jgi:hypothetical protein
MRSLFDLNILLKSLGHPAKETLVSIFKFSLFLKSSMYQEHKHNISPSIFFYLNGFHL